MRPIIRAGELKHTLTIVAPAGTVAVDDYTVDTEVPASIVADIAAFQPKESLAIGGVQTATYYTVSTRYRTDLLASMVLHEECCTLRRFQIVGIVPSDRRDAVDLRCVTA